MDVDSPAGPGAEPAGGATAGQMETQLRASEQIVEAMRARGDLPLDRLLTETLDHVLAESGLDGLMIASEDGLPVAQSSGADQAEILAAIGCLFEATVRRAQSEGLVASVEEMTLRGFGGEQIIVRYLPGFQRKFALVAWSRQPCAHRRATMRAMKVCGGLLAQSIDAAPPPKTGKSRRSTPGPKARQNQESKPNG